MPRKDVLARAEYDHARYLRQREERLVHARAYRLANAAKISETVKKNYQKNRVLRLVTERRRYECKGRDSVLFNKYRIRETQYNELLTSQGGGCALCGSDKLLGVDHCHTTGKVRGILCRKCNGGIGLLRDDPELLAKAYRYLTDRELRDMFVPDKE